MTEQPEKKFSTGSLSAAIWQNKGKKKSGEEITFRTVTFQRRYTDKDGNWKTTNTLRTNDLPKAALVLQKAYEYLVLKEIQDTSSEDVVEEVVM